MGVGIGCWGGLACWLWGGVWGGEEEVWYRAFTSFVWFCGIFIWEVCGFGFRVVCYARTLCRWVVGVCGLSIGEVSVVGC